MQLLPKPEVTLESLHDWTIAVTSAWCRYDDGIIYISEVNHYSPSQDVVFCEGVKLSDDGQSADHFNDNDDPLYPDKFDFTPVPTGYFNCKKKAAYLMRKPSKQWRRGLSAGAFFTRGEYRFALQSHVHAAAAFAHKHLSIPESYESVISGKRKASAFADNYAVVQDYSLIPDTAFLEYKGSIIGVLDDNLVATLPKSVEFLSEELSQYVEVNVL